MRVFFLIFAILLSAQSAYAKTCLVLSGGGALGIAHVGVLKVLEEYHVPIDCIAGTSMGAIVGGLYASGYSVAELENLVSTSEWATLFSEPNNREDFTFQQKRNDLNFLMNYRIGIDKNGKASIPKGAILGNHLDLAFLAFTMRSNNIHNFDQLPIPFRAVATDVETGNPVILSKGSLAKAMRASMSVPGVFLPVEIDGKFLVDGGAANNLPIDVAKAMGADRVIAVHIPTNLKKYNYLNSALAVAGQMISILIKQNEDRQIETLTSRDIYLRPDINGYSSSDFAKAKAIIKPGILAAQTEKQKLSTIAVSAEEYKTIREKQYRPKPANPTIDFVELHNNSAINNEIIKNKLSVKAGEKLSIEQLQKDLSKLYGTGNFEKISFDITQNHPDKAGVIVSINDTEKLPENPTGVSITADAKQWSEDNVRFGLNLEDNFDGDATYNMSFRLSRTMLNDLGGEAYIDGQLGENNLLKGEIYQPLSVNNGLFVNAKGGYDGRNIPISEQKQKLAEYRLTRYTSQFDVGSTLLDNDADIRVGIERGFGYANLKTGSISSAVDNDFDIGAAIIAFNYDTLDEVNFPKHGIYSISTFRKSDSTFGASEDFTQAEQRLSIVNTFGKNTIILSNSTSLSLEDDTPVQGNFLSGGFLTFSGYQTDQIFSPNIISNSIKGYRQIYGDGESLFEVPIYAGTSIEIGDYQQKRQDLMDNTIFSGSMFLGADTFFGPVYLGYGQAEGGAKSLYMFLGRTF